MSHYYNDDLSLSEIAENEGTTRQAVSDIIRRGEALIRKYESECGYCGKISELKRICQSDISGDVKLEQISAIIEDF